MIDTHAHIHDKEFDLDFNETVLRAKAAGVSEIWLQGTDETSFFKMRKAKNNYPGYFKLFAGIHPEELKKDFKQQISLLEKEIKEYKYDGIGEIGIDLHWEKDRLNDQIEALKLQLDIAIKNRLPVSLHIRDAYDIALEVIRPYFKKGLRGIFHSFSGNHTQAKEITETGNFLLGVNGIITFKNSKMPEILKKTDIKYIATETDSPYLAPVPHRGKRNEPAYLPEIIQKLSEIYGKDKETVERDTQNSAKKILG